METKGQTIAFIKQIQVYDDLPKILSDLARFAVIQKTVYCLTSQPRQKAVAVPRYFPRNEATKVEEYPNQEKLKSQKKVELKVENYQAFPVEVALRSQKTTSPITKSMQGKFEVFHA